MPMHYILLCRSLTTAQRAERALRRAGVFSSVTKAPRGADPGGCAYAVKLGERNLARALTLLREQGVPVGRIYSIDEAGNIREAAP